MFNFNVAGAFTVGLSWVFLAGCSMLNSPVSDAPTPPSVERQARLLQLPDDLRVPRETALRVVFPNSPVVTASVAGTAPVVVTPVSIATASPATVSAPSTAPVTAVSPVVAVAPAPVRDASKLGFAPYVPTVKQNQPPKTWETAPKYDFPWVPGAQPARVNEESTVGVGTRLFGRLFAKVEFGAGAVAQTNRASATAGGMPQKTKLHASDVNCSNTTCLDAARDMLMEEAQNKGWRLLLNRRISMQQSFQFQRDDRVVWIEVTSVGKNVLQLEYNLLPSQDSAAR